MNEIKCYTDASFDPKSRVAIIGWRINKQNIRVNVLKNTTNTRAEIVSLIKLIDNLESDKKYIIYTDCQSILNRIASKDLLIEKDFKNSKGEELNNADLYKKLFEVLTPNIKLVHIDGHLPTKFKDDNDKNFSELDKYVRSELRKLTNSIDSSC